ncbi:MAG: flagellar filament capping protein FliD [Pontibacterium sp.]
MGSNIISSLGAGSGIDVSSLVDSLVAVEKAPQSTRLEARKETLDAQISAYGVLKSSLSEFQAVLKPLVDADTFNARAVSFPDTDVITPNQLDANAQAGSYQVEVLAVAQSQSLASAKVADPGDVLGAGDITIRFGAWDSYTDLGGPVGFTQNGDKEALTLSLDADDSLNDLADKINAADAGLQASVIKTDSEYQLLLTSPSGAENAIEITADAALSQFSFQEGDAGLLQTQAAVDASLKVNGLAVSRSTNEIDDVIQGLSFTLNKAGVDETINFSISDDKETGEQAIRDFVEAYNTLYETMKNLTGTSTDEETDEVTVGSLSTDGSAKSMLAQVRRVMTAAVPGVDSSFSALTNVGIRTELDGTLGFNEDDFEAALEDNFDQVSALFSQQSSSTNTNVSVNYGSYVDKAIAGIYDVEVTTEPAKGLLNGNGVADFSTALLTGADDAYSFTIKVDGVESNSIQLPNNKTYADGDALAADLQSLINGDSLLKDVGAAVNVAYNSADDRFEFTSRQYGATSSVSFSAASLKMGTKLGITEALTGTVGKDAAGTIGGKTAFGSGNVLLPEVDSNPYGLNLTLEAGSLGSSAISYSKGLAGELSLLIDGLLSGSGSIQSREDSINSQLDTIGSDQEALDTRMVQVETRLLNQFLAMERILASLQTTGDSLTGLLDTLPFTAKTS